MCSRIGILANPGLLCCEFRPTLRLSGSPVQKLNLSSCHSVTHNRYIYFCCVLVISSQQRDTGPPGRCHDSRRSRNLWETANVHSDTEDEEMGWLGEKPWCSPATLGKIQNLVQKVSTGAVRQLSRCVDFSVIKNATYEHSSIYIPRGGGGGGRGYILTSDLYGKSNEASTWVNFAS